MRLLAASAGVVALCLPHGAGATGSILIWPVNPTIPVERPAGAIWLENHGTEPAVVQVRLFAWSQGTAGDAFAPEQPIVASPPMATIAPGARQLVRLTDTRSTRPAGEQAFRLVLDEVPTKAAEGSTAVRFQMRYSLPLFVYGATPAADREEKPRLACSIVQQGGASVLRVTNKGGLHARLTNGRIEGGRAGTQLGAGLLGYALGGGTLVYPLRDSPSAQTKLSVEVNGKDRVNLPCS